MPQFTIGADPEFMIVEREELKNAIGLLPSKDKPLSKNGSKFYFDNVLAEVALKPAKNRDEFLSNIQTALKNLSDFLKPNKFVIRASGNYPKKELNSIESKIVSCSPEWNVYTLQAVLPPDEDVDLIDGYYQFKTPFRSAGGHIHLGSELLKDPLFAFNMVRMMDLFVGIPSLFLDTDDTSKNRRKIYGHAGSHRVPSHGLEYRSLGNFWLSSPVFAELVYDLTAFTFDFVCKNNHEKFWSYEEDVDLSLIHI